MGQGYASSTMLAKISERIWAWHCARQRLCVHMTNLDGVVCILGRLQIRHFLHARQRGHGLQALGAPGCRDVAAHMVSCKERAYAPPPGGGRGGCIAVAPHCECAVYQGCMYGLLRASYCQHTSNDSTQMATKH
jgi:hypothetical protein